MELFSSGETPCRKKNSKGYAKEPELLALLKQRFPTSSPPIQDLTSNLQLHKHHKGTSPHLDSYFPISVYSPQNILSS
jgi:hypothetical protein